MATGEPGNSNLPREPANDGKRANPAEAAADGDAGASRDLGKLAHDMRNFLAPINNAVQVLRIRASSDQALVALADMIDRQVTGMRKLIDGLGNTQQRPAAPLQRSELLAAESQRQSPADEGSQAGMRLLLVDDNAAFRESLSGVLRDLGHATREAEDGVQALEIAHKWVPQLVFLDVNMPGLNGYELARRFRAEFPASNMKLVMLSGDNLTETATRAAQAAGFDLCLDKLSSMDAFRRLLETLAVQTA